MDKKGNLQSYLIILFIAITALVIIAIYIEKNDKNNNIPNISDVTNVITDAIPKLPNFSDVYDMSPSIKVANWNLQIFGDTKAENSFLMLQYLTILKDYDIIFIQEIRDKDGSAFDKLCLLMGGGYNCNISSRAGRSSSKEQYGIIYRDYINLTELKDFNPDRRDRWERPPIAATFNASGYIFTIYNIHTKPDDAEREIAYLNDIVKDEGNVIVMGDLNADCDYYSEPLIPDFDGWNWIIEDDADTTVGRSYCAYDRIILNDNAYDEYLNHSIDTSITEDLSDHYLVWVELDKLEDR